MTGPERRPCDCGAVMLLDGKDVSTDNAGHSLTECGRWTDRADGACVWVLFPSPRPAAERGQ